jgi:phosphoglycerate dehydrogenase-like enzyme
MAKPFAAFYLDSNAYELIYGPTERESLSAMLDIAPVVITRSSMQDHLDVLARTEIMLSGWGAPVMDEAFLEHTPSLKAVFYGAGSIRGITTDAFWSRNITITSAVEANSLPVADYTVGAILLSLKHFWRFAHKKNHEVGLADPDRKAVPGNYHSTVGVVSLGAIARRVLHLLQPYDLFKVAYDPFMSDDTIYSLGAEPCSLETVFARSDVVSLHTPLLPETIGMITGELLNSMKPGATFINTSRGKIVREKELVDVMRARPDLTAILDVTDPEPPLPGAPILDLPNVIITPHIAGSIGPECRRMGHYMVQEVKRFLAGEPLLHAISKETAGLRA